MPELDNGGFTNSRRVSVLCGIGTGVLSVFCALMAVSMVLNMLTSQTYATEWVGLGAIISAAILLGMLCAFFIGNARDCRKGS